MEGEPKKPDAPDVALEAGEKCAVTRDILVDGRPAFRKGEMVEVKKVDPNPSRKEYRYVVRSESLGKLYQLSDRDLRAVGRAATRSDSGSLEIKEKRTRVAGKKPVPKKTGRRRMAAVALALLILAALAVSLTLVFTLGGENETEKMVRLEDELAAVLEKTGVSSKYFLADLRKAYDSAANPEEFKPLGAEMAKKYSPLFREHYREVKRIRSELGDINPPQDSKAKLEILIDKANNSSELLLKYIAALEQIKEGNIEEATKALGGEQGGTGQQK